MKPYLHIHINKTGGTSICRALGKPKKHFTISQWINNHGSLAELEERFTFTFVRNPFSRMLSMYKYRMAHNKHGLREEHISFTDFLRLTLEERQEPWYNNPNMFQPCWEWITLGGVLKVDAIYWFEEYNKMFRGLMRDLGRPLNHKDKIPHTNKTQHSHYCNHYTPYGVELIQHYFRSDLEHFNYTFTKQPKIHE